MTDFGVWHYVLLTGVPVIAFITNDWVKRTTDRRGFRRAIRTEASETRELVENLLENCANLTARTSSLQEAVTRNSVNFEILDAVPAGWNLYEWTFPLSDCLRLLTEDEGLALLRFSDAWAKVVTIQGQMREAYLKLVDTLPDAGGAPQSTLRQRETAQLVHDSALSFVSALNRLHRRAHELGRVVSKNLCLPWSAQEEASPDIRR